VIRPSGSTPAGPAATVPDRLYPALARPAGRSQWSGPAPRHDPIEISGRSDEARQPIHAGRRHGDRVGPETAHRRARPASLFGDDSAQFTVFLWLLSSGLLGFARPRRPWLWALFIGPWLSLTNLVLHLLGLPGSIHPDTYTTILILLPLSLAVCSLGAYVGALVRRALRPLSPSP
jgi:hypothetical protein